MPQIDDAETVDLVRLACGAAQPHIDAPAGHRLEHALHAHLAAQVAGDLRLAPADGIGGENRQPQRQGVVAQIVAEHAQHLTARPVQSRLQRAQRETHARGKLPLRYLRQVMLLHRRPALRRQIAQRAIEQQRHIVAAQLLGGIEGIRVGKLREKRVCHRARSRRGKTASRASVRCPACAGNADKHCGRCHPARRRSVPHRAVAPAISRPPAVFPG